MKRVRLTIELVIDTAGDSSHDVSWIVESVLNDGDFRRAIDLHDMKGAPQVRVREERIVTCYSPTHEKAQAIQRLRGKKKRK